jgi:hypothetical protein
MVASKIQGPAAAMFDEPSQIVGDELFEPTQSPIDARLQILETRLNEIYDYLKSGGRSALVVNNIHRGIR